MTVGNETFFKVEIPVLQDMVPRPYLTWLQKIWTLVPKTIKNHDGLKSFKQKIRKWKPDCPCSLCKVYL